MAIAIVEELWTRIRAAIDDKIAVAEDAAVRAETGAATVGGAQAVLDARDTAVDAAERAEQATDGKVDKSDVSVGMVANRIVRRESDSPNVRVSEAPTQPYHAASLSWVDRNFADATSVPLRVDDFGAVADGETDNTYAFNQTMNAARAEKRPVYIPAGRWKIDGTVDISGAHIHGEIGGYRNEAGTVIVGNGTNVAFEQVQNKRAHITYSIRRLRFEDVGTGISMTYAIQCTIEDVWIDATGDALRVGTNDIIGPIWCMFLRVTAISSGGNGLVLEGNEWCNANHFHTCDFRGATDHAAVFINAVGGYGAIKNIFENTEIAGDGCGYLINGTNRGTMISNGYLESKGPAVVTRGMTHDLQLVSNIYGSTRNNIAGFGPRFIDHQAGSTQVRIDGGWVTTSAADDQADLRFIGSDNPSGLDLAFTNRPRLSAASAGFLLFDPNNVEPSEVRMDQSLHIRSRNFPSVSLAYPDESREFRIRRNGSQGGSDYGVYFQNEGKSSFFIDSNARTVFMEEFGSSKTTTASTLGSVVRRLPIRNSSGTLIGYIPIYDSID